MEGKEEGQGRIVAGASAETVNASSVSEEDCTPAARSRQENSIESMGDSVELVFAPADLLTLIFLAVVKVARRQCSCRNALSGLPGGEIGPVHEPNPTVEQACCFPAVVHACCR